MQTCEPGSPESEQYKTDANLSARIQLHARFSTNPYGWFKWVFDRLQLPPQARILEIACGRGDLWHENMQRIPPGWDITLTDASAGMLASTQSRLADSLHHFSFQQADIQAIPFGDEQFDAVIANHMLYYVSDKPRAFREVLRVLKPAGLFFTTTVGARHLRELVQLAKDCLPAGAAFDMDSSKLDFLLENGAAQLSPFFGRVDLQRYEDSLYVTQPEPLAQYIFSDRRHGSIQGSIQQVQQVIAQRMKEKGGISIYKDSGIFITRKGG